MDIFHRSQAFDEFLRLLGDEAALEEYQEFLASMPVHEVVLRPHNPPGVEVLRALVSDAELSAPATSATQRASGHGKLIESGELLDVLALRDTVW